MVGKGWLDSSEDLSHLVHALECKDGLVAILREWNLVPFWKLLSSSSSGPRKCIRLGRINDTQILVCDSRTWTLVRCFRAMATKCRAPSKASASPSTIVLPGSFWSSIFIKHLTCSRGLASVAWSVGNQSVAAARQGSPPRRSSCW